MIPDNPQTVEQVHEITKINFKFVPFNEIPNYTIDQLFDVNNRLLSIYLTKPYFGHYIALKRDEIKHEITFFNSSGTGIDQDIHLIDKSFAKKSNQDFPHILVKLLKSGYKTRYMDYPLQKPNTNICGRLCALFLRYFQIDEDDLVEIFKNMSTDSVIVFTEYLKKIPYKG